MPRFTYHAHGLAIGGHITKPADHHIESLASCVLPPTGGRASASEKGKPLTLAGEFILSFDSAQTTIQGEETSSGVHTTLVTTTVTNLNVANVLKADEITAKISLKYTIDGDHIEIGTEGSRYLNLTINGQPWDVQVDHAMSHEAADYDSFKNNHPEHPEIRHKIKYSLGRHPKLTFDQNGYGYHYEPNFGRIYFAEWLACHYTQRLTMLRLQLGSPQSGDLTVSDGSGNGAPYPPP